MRVLHFYKSYFPDSVGGAETVIGQLARGTMQFGVESTVLSLSRSPGGNTVFADGHWARKSRLDFEFASTGFSLSVFRDFARLAENFDLVHYHFPWPVMDVAHFIARHGKPSVVTYHSDIVRQRRLLALYRPLMHRFLSSVTAIVATSPNYASSSATLQRYLDKVSVIPAGTDDLTAAPRNPASEAYWRKRLGPRFFLFVGALRYYKGLDYLIEAAALTGYPVVIAGKGEFAGRLAEAVASRKLDNVHLLGEISEDDKITLLRLCEAFTFPSHLRSEAFGIALVEAACAGRPMISCEIGTGTSYINLEGETGFVVPPADPAALADAMRRVWNDPANAAEMGGRARQRYESHFTTAAMSAAYARLYRELMANERG
jgi:rhamnosyl/mannosyltransferase